MDKQAGDAPWRSYGAEPGVWSERMLAALEKGVKGNKWRELIKKVWEADPLLCPQCHKEMRIIALIDEAAVIERILRHLGLWEAGVRVESARDPL